MNEILDGYYGLQNCGLFIISPGRTFLLLPCLNVSKQYFILLSCFWITLPMSEENEAELRLCIGISHPILAFSMTICKSFILPKPLFF